MNYLLIFFAVFLFTIQTICFKEFNRTYMKNVASYFSFNFLYMLIVVAILLVSGVSTGGYSSATILLGALFGLLFIITIFCYMKAMETGPLSFTILFSSFGIIIPVFSGVIFWNESINAVQVIGLLLLFATFYLGSSSTEGSSRKVNTKWLLFCMINFIGNGLIMTTAKWHQMLLPGEEINEFLVMAFGTAAILSFALMLHYRFMKKQVIRHLKTTHLLSIGLATGVVTAFGNQLLVYLASKVPSIIQFPLINGGIVIVSTVASVFIFKDRLSRNGMIGISLGIVALFLLSAE